MADVEMKGVRTVSRTVLGSDQIHLYIALSSDEKRLQVEVSTR